MNLSPRSDGDSAVNAPFRYCSKVNTSARHLISGLLASVSLVVAGCGSSNDDPTENSSERPIALDGASDPYGESELELREALAPFITIEIEDVNGDPLELLVPESAACAQSNCAGAAALHFLAYENDVINDRLVREWNALSLPSCEYCMDTLSSERRTSRRARA